METTSYKGRLTPAGQVQIPGEAGLSVPSPLQVGKSENLPFRKTQSGAPDDSAAGSAGESRAACLGEAAFLGNGERVQELEKVQKLKLQMVVGTAPGLGAWNLTPPRMVIP